MNRSSKIHLALLLVIAALGSVFSTAYARTDLPIRSNVSSPSLLSADQRALADFVAQVKNGEAGTLTGVHVPGEFSYQVVQQPTQNAGFVSSQPDTLTQFRLASQYGTTGLLAHNTLAGASFSNLAVGDQIVLVFGNGELKNYQVQAVSRFQALNPTSPYSDFVDMADGQSLLSATDLFYRVYQGNDQVVLQTCIENAGNPSWGRLFISAVPASLVIPETPISDYIRFKMARMDQFLS